MNLLNQVILPDPEFYWRNEAFFQHLILDPEAQALIQAAKLEARSRRRLNRLLLEAAFPTALQKSYVPYRERLRDLIQVLMRGASTQQGILDLVAANLGIFADSEAAQAARKTITIEEFQPVLESETVRVMPSVREAADGAAATDGWLNPFTLTNPNVEPTAITLALSLTASPTIAKASLARISRLTLVNAEDQRPYFTYGGGLEAGDNLRLQADGRLVRNGAYIATMSPVVLPVGHSNWYLTAHVGEWPGRLDQGQFDFSGFDQAESTVRPMTAAQARNYTFIVNSDLVGLTPAVFRSMCPGTSLALPIASTTIPTTPVAKFPALSTGYGPLALTLLLPTPKPFAIATLCTPSSPSFRPTAAPPICMTNWRPSTPPTRPTWLSTTPWPTST